jgi:hypothetical protein
MWAPHAHAPHKDFFVKRLGQMLEPSYRRCKRERLSRQTPASSGHAAALPSAAKNFRRPMWLAI